jgi:hypothetical protein
MRISGATEVTSRHWSMWSIHVLCARIECTRQNKVSLIICFPGGGLLQKKAETKQRWKEWWRKQKKRVKQRWKIVSAFFCKSPPPGKYHPKTHPFIHHGPQIGIPPRKGVMKEAEEKSKAEVKEAKMEEESREQSREQSRDSPLLYSFLLLPSSLLSSLLRLCFLL